MISASAIQAPVSPDPESAARITLGLLASTAVHLVLLAGLTLTPPQAPSPSRPLQVEIRSMAPPEAAVTEIVTREPAEVTAPEPRPSLPEEIQPPQTPSRTPAPPPAPVELNLPFELYYAGRDVDVRASQLNEVQLVYPEQPYLRRDRGTVILTLFINEHGAIDHISLVESAPPGMFEGAALDAARALQFSPAIKNGRPVKSRKTIEIVFNPWESIYRP